MPTFHVSLVQRVWEKADVTVTAATPADAIIGAHTVLYLRPKRKPQITPRRFSCDGLSRLTVAPLKARNPSTMFGPTAR